MSETVKPQVSAIKIAGTVTDAASVSTILDHYKVPFTYIETCNWPKEFPYAPAVRFRIAHTGDSILLNFRCNEEYVRAEAEADNGPVWEDSCVEFFFSPDGKKYYNIECNCAATLLCAIGDGRANRRHCPPELLKSVKRYSSIGTGVFPSRQAPDEWEVSLVIPTTLFFDDPITDFSGMKAKANFYKCGDKLPTPHFLSWAPIDVPSPDFHRPEFFGDITFQQ